MALTYDQIRDFIGQSSQDQLSAIGQGQSQALNLIGAQRQQADQLGLKQAKELQARMGEQYGSDAILGGQGGVASYAKTFYQPSTDYSSLVNIALQGAGQKAGILGQQAQAQTGLMADELKYQQQLAEIERNKPGLLSQILGGVAGVGSLIPGIGTAVGLISGGLGAIAGGAEKSKGG